METNDDKRILQMGISVKLQGMRPPNPYVCNGGLCGLYFGGQALYVPAAVMIGHLFITASIRLQMFERGSQFRWILP
jgi:hypothetical protein